MENKKLKQQYENLSGMIQPLGEMNKVGYYTSGSEDNNFDKKSFPMFLNKSLKPKAPKTNVLIFGKSGSGERKFFINV